MRQVIKWTDSKDCHGGNTETEKKNENEMKVWNANFLVMLIFDLKLKFWHNSIFDTCINKSCSSALGL